MNNQPTIDSFNLYVALTEETVAVMEAAVEECKKLPNYVDAEELSQWRDDADAWAEATDEFCKAIIKLNERYITCKNAAITLQSNPYYKTFVESRIPSKPSIWKKIKQFFRI